MPSFTSQIIEHKSRTVCLEDSCSQLVYQIPITCVRIFPGSLIIMSSCQRSPQSVIPNQTFPCQPAFHPGRHRTCNIPVTQLKKQPDATVPYSPRPPSSISPHQSLRQAYRLPYPDKSRTPASRSPPVEHLSLSLNRQYRFSSI